MAENVYKKGASKGFAVVFRSAAQDKNLSLRARGLFLLMQSLPENWNYTQAGLVRISGATLHQIKKCLKELEHGGYLIRRQSHDETGKFSGAVYELQEESNQAPLDEIPTAVTPTAVKRTQQNIYIKNNNINIPPISPTGDGAGDADLNQKTEFDSLLMFSRFWAAYPRKQKKQDALKAWKKLNPDLALCRVMSAALKTQKQSDQWLRDGGRYIPMAGPWIRGRRWEDDPGPMAAPDSGYTPDPPGEWL